VVVEDGVMREKVLGKVVTRGRRIGVVGY